ncbi:hypothetical protein HWV62_4794 [Athelia sp. TMB]|nr:hypothetical protein HWV62_4794 [Athelia sp. TMB]
MKCHRRFWTEITDAHAQVGQMSTRVDALEASIQDIINGDTSVPASPLPSSVSAGTPFAKRSGSALPQ